MSTNTPCQGVEFVLFDLDGTLRHSRPNYNEAVLELLAQWGLVIEPARRQQALRWVHYYWANSPESQQDFQTFDDWPALLVQYMRRFLRVLGCSETQAHALAPRVYRYMDEHYQPQDWVEPTTPAVLATIREAGYRLGVVSNRSMPFDEQLVALGLDGYFDFTLAAGEIQAWKPDPRIFQEALARAQTCSSRTLYVGDNYYADIAGARNVGIRAVLLDTIGLFPDADCPVITSLSELPALLPAGESAR